MMKWECTECKATWWCAGLTCPQCPECESERINPTFETDDEEVDDVMADEYFGDDYSEGLE